MQLSASTSSPLPSLPHPYRHEASTSTTRHPNDVTHPDSDLQVLSTRGAGNTARSLLKQDILSEEEYITHLSHIIKRDFFPSLANLDAQHEILDAFESEDPKQVEESIRRMRILWTPTPGSTRGGGGKRDKKKSGG
ncbi:BZ3500_MvSof-1268-A1-R1_Chr7-2g09484 [Microbotryum saponariae]|uniref:BZ3500_MvSof-1268-A1-R1_Chr7-2g09484 protein n=1 Tax=Microbotryum saponariae TaxID=289078 RepID=A0A2X0NBZ6_9BASI|nr:BZ3501_MvSof-1269-A2-R1_Chr7-1g09184 [Microbotryum saponariae]SDA02537.1 BZ3500_MvSof-1268-A1-R1_Chr7-2g09484 [Microbotryum saponariae]